MRRLALLLLLALAACGSGPDPDPVSVSPCAMYIDTAPGGYTIEAYTPGEPQRLSRYYPETDEILVFEWGSRTLPSPCEVRRFRPGDLPPHKLDRLGLAL